MLSCGEASGDLYAGALVAALRRREPDIDVFGLGGERFKAAGGRLVADFHGLSVTGLTEVISVLPRTLATMKRLVTAAKTEKPQALVLIDYPDFNFRLMTRIKRLGIPVIYYVSPQLWAWRAGRIKLMKRRVDRVLPIFPFEEAIYQREGIDVRFVGHPLIDLATPQLIARSVPAEAESGSGEARARVAAGKPDQRGGAARSGDRRGGAEDRRSRPRRPVCDRAGAEPGRRPVRRLWVAGRHAAHRRRRKQTMC